tara:strand:- start:679 stop:909 length:231 start_codon:yes stop_codon:yes gene_type:complete
MNTTYYLISPDNYQKIKNMPNFEKIYKKNYKEYLIKCITELKHRPNVLYLINRSKNPKQALEVLKKFKINYSHKYI